MFCFELSRVGMVPPATGERGPRVLRRVRSGNFHLDHLGTREPLSDHRANLIDSLLAS